MLGLKLMLNRYGGLSAIPFSSDALHYSKDPTVGTDRIGKYDDTSVMSRKIVGNGSLYGEVYSLTDGTPFTDADLPTNYRWSGECTYDKLDVNGYFGFYPAGDNRYYFSKSTALTEGVLRLGIGDPFSDIQTNLTIKYN